MISLIATVSSSSSVLGYGGAPEQSSSGNYSVELVFDKETYVIGDAINNLWKRLANTMKIEN